MARLRGDSPELSISPIVGHRIGTAVDWQMVSRSSTPAVRMRWLSRDRQLSSGCKDIAK